MAPGMKKRVHKKDSSQKRKKQQKEGRKVKRVKKENEPTTEQVMGEMLDQKIIKEGTLLLGCITEVRFNCAIVSLPGCNVGTVPFSNVSRAFTEELKTSTKEEQDEGVSLDSVITLGAVYPCKVMQVSCKEDLKTQIITLSIDPNDVNEDLRPNSLYKKMVVYGAVDSVEDHGYIIDLGVKGASGFLPFSLHCDNSTLTKGQVVATVVKKVPGPKSGNVVTLSYISFSETYPVVEDTSLKLSSITPGANLAVNVTNVKHPFYYMKFADFNACANVSCISPSQRSLSDGMKVSGTVLYVQPVTHMIYLFVGSVPTPQTFKKFFGIKRHDLLQNVKFEFGFFYKFIFKLNKGQMGFVKKSEILEKGEFSHESLLKEPVVPKARAVFLHYMDNLVQLSFRESVINQTITNFEDVKIGDIFEATVKKHVDSGMFVQICPGLTGFVNNVFMSDVLLTMPEKLFKPDSKVKCRVVSKSNSSSLDLTCKDSLLNLPETEILKSYEEAIEGQSYKGVIVQKKDEYILVAFFNGVKGLIPAEEVPKSSLLYVGHTVSCSVTHCNVPKQRLKLSMIGGPSSESKGTKKQKEPELSANDIALRKTYEPMKKHKAVITNIIGHQLNILVNKQYKGRVHITQVGVCEENSLPLADFSVGMKIKVHVLGQCSRKTHSFLPISHRTLSKNFLECSLTYPPPAPMDRKLRPGMEVTGYVKEVTNTFASLWLSPTCVGTLEFVNFSDNAKVLRKLKKGLKIGLSFNVTVLKIATKQHRSSKQSTIMLTRLGNKPLQPGTNVVGLVEKANCEQGLTLRLPQGYSGQVGLTDLQDVWSPLEHEVAKCQRLRFVLCNLVEVNHFGKSCVVSLRKSRMYGHQSNESLPEVTEETVKVGELYRGFASKRTSTGELSVEFGRSLVGRVQSHSCAVLNCGLCEVTQSVLNKYSPGTIMQVKVLAKEKGAYSLLLPELEDEMEGLETPKPSRLKITEDIDWDEV